MRMKQRMKMKKMMEKMMEKMKLTSAFAFVTFLFAILLTAHLAFAAITVTISAPSTVTQGSNIPISASFVASTGDSGSFYFTCDQTTSGEVSPEDGYSVTTSTSKTYTFTPSQATTYENCKVSDGGTQSSSTVTIKSISPSTLTVAGSPSSTTSSSFTLSINVTNPTADAVTTSYSLDCSAVGSCSGDQISANVEIAAGSSTSLSWTATATSSGTITFQLGSNSNAFSSTVSLPSTTTTTTAAAAAAVSSVTTAVGKLTKKYTSIIPLSPKKITTADLGATGTDLTQIYIAVKSRVTSVEITIEKLSEQPADVATAVPGNVYKYISVTKKNLDDENIETGKIKFKVGKSWITDNNVDADTIALYRYAQDEWNELSTSKVSEDDDYIYYEAETPGFSYFAISGEKIAVETTTTTTTVAPTTTTLPPTTTTMPAMPEEIAGIQTWVVAVIVAVIAIAVVVVILMMKGVIKLP